MAFLDLSPSESYIDAAPTLHLRAYSVNQKGRSEATVLEDIAINEPEKRTGTYIVVSCVMYSVYIGLTILKWDKGSTFVNLANLLRFVGWYKLIYRVR